MNEEEKESIEEFRKQLRLAINVDDITTTIRNSEVRTILNLIDKLQKKNEEWDRKFCDLQNLYFKLQDESESKRKEYQETYKDVREELKELKKENEELKERIREHTLLISPYYVKENFIPVQKVKDKIRHYQELQDNYIKKYDEINEGLQAMINVLQELLEGRK